MQVGCIGLIKATKKFDPDRGVSFITYAVPVIVGEVKNHLRDHGWAVKVPRKIQKHKLAVQRAVESRRARWLDPDQLDRTPVPGREATGQTATADADQDRVDIPGLRPELATEGALAQKCHRMVEGVNLAGAGVRDPRPARGKRIAIERAADHEAADTITAAGQAITGQLDAVEDTLIQKRTVDGQTVINWPSRLNFHYIRLRMAVDGSEGVVTRGARDLFADLSAQWRVHQATLNAILGPQLEAFNELIRTVGIPAIMIPGRRELVP